MVARFAAETSSKGLKPLHAREHLPSRIATICPCISAKFRQTALARATSCTGARGLFNAQANAAYDGQRTLREVEAPSQPNRQE
jgi:hypothetical protein